MSKTITGGCQCGAVRYEIAGSIQEVSHCHCSMCRRLHGSLFVTFGTVTQGNLTITGEESLGSYRSSDRITRRFCIKCGGQIMAEVDDDPDTPSICLGSLDPGQAPGHDKANESHIFWESRVTWYDPGDDVPRVEGYGV